MKADNGDRTPIGRLRRRKRLRARRRCAHIKGRSANIEMQESFPDTPESWTVAVTNRGDKKAGDATVKLYAVCIKK